MSASCAASPASSLSGILGLPWNPRLSSVVSPHQSSFFIGFSDIQLGWAVLLGALQAVVTLRVPSGHAGQGHGACSAKTLDA